MREQFLSVQQETANTVNKEKTKLLHVSKDAIRVNSIRLENTKFESVTEFKYMTAVLNNNNSNAEEIRRRTAAAGR